MSGSSEASNSSSYSLSREDLEVKLNEQLELLKASCDALDLGRNSESIRIAASLRTLLHDTKNSQSLFKTLNIKSMNYLSTAWVDPRENWAPYFGLVSGVAGNGEGGTEQFNFKFIARLRSERVAERWLTFSQWWQEPVLDDRKGNVLARKDLVLAMANQDGGAHVDPSLSIKYAHITRFNSMDITVGKDEYGCDFVEIRLVHSFKSAEIQRSQLRRVRGLEISGRNPAHSTVRQIAFEVQMSLQAFTESQRSK